MAITLRSLYKFTTASSVGFLLMAALWACAGAESGSADTTSDTTDLTGDSADTAGETSDVPADVPADVPVDQTEVQDTQVPDSADQSDTPPGCGPESCEPNTSVCVDETQWAMCLPDGDGCGVLAKATACPANKRCSGGLCVDAVTCIDLDGDGYGEGCPLGPDCNDNDRNINPAAVERCDGVDNNCNDLIDEDFPNLGQSCQVGVGACRRSGNYVCSVDQLSTVCDAQPGPPGVEMCGDEIDSDCDGNNNNGFESIGQSCTRGTGACQTSGTTRCDLTDRTKTFCDAPTPAGSREICDGQDNDCDGVADNGGVCTTCVDDAYAAQTTTSVNALQLSPGNTFPHMTVCGNYGTPQLKADWFLIAASSSVNHTISVSMTHPTGNNGVGHPWANLDIDFWCGGTYCGALTGTAGTTSTTFNYNACSCAAGSRITLRVYPHPSSDNPASGTPYSITRSN